MPPPKKNPMNAADTRTLRKFWGELDLSEFADMFDRPEAEIAEYAANLGLPGAGKKRRAAPPPPAIRKPERVGTVAPALTIPPPRPAQPVDSAPPAAAVVQPAGPPIDPQTRPRFATTIFLHDYRTGTRVPVPVGPAEPQEPDS